MSHIGFKKHILAIFLGIYLLAFAPFIFAQKAYINTEYITITSPAQDYVTQTPTVSIIGEVSRDVGGLILNEEPVKLLGDNKFSITKVLSDPGNYIFEFISLSPKRLLASEKVLETVSLNISYQPKKRADQRDRYRKSEGTPPSITLISPKENERLAKTHVLFKGKINPFNGIEIIKLNGDRLEIEADGSFYHRAALDKTGSSTTFILTARSLEGESSIKRVIFNKTDVDPGAPKPELILHSPQKNMRSIKDKILFKGDVKHASRVMINGKDIGVNEKGRFFLKLPLKKANQDNVFTVTVIGKNGKEKEIRRKVYYKALSEGAPHIMISTPQKNDVITKKTVLIKGTLKNTSRIWVNDQEVPVKNGSTFSYQAVLKNPGTYNTFFVRAQSPLNKKSMIKLRVFYDPNKKVEKKSLSQKSKISGAIKHKTSKGVQRLESYSSSTAVDEAVQQKLAKKISIELDGAPLKEVIKIISQKSGLNMVADDQLDGRVTLMIKQVSIQDALTFLCDTQGLGYRLAGNTLLIGEPSKLNTPTKLSTTFVTVSHIDVEKAAAILTPYLSKEESVQFYKKKRLLILHTGKDKATEFLSLIQKIDQEETPRVILDMQIIEAAVGGLHQHGLVWKNGGNTSSYRTATLSTKKLNAMVSSLKQKGKMATISQPRLNTLDKQGVTFFDGKKIPKVKKSWVVDYVHSGLGVEITPFVDQNNNDIRLLIKPTISLVVGHQDHKKNIPILKESSIETSTWVKGNESILIGGLLTSTEMARVSEKPQINKRSLFGNLKKGNEAASEMIIMITPRLPE